MFDYRILESTKKKHQFVEKLVIYQYYIDCIIEAIKLNDLETLNNKRLYKIIEMLEEYDFIFDKEYTD